MDYNLQNYKYLKKYFTTEKLSKYPSDHIFADISKDEKLADRYFSVLDNIFEKVENIFGENVCEDYVKKLICKSNHKFGIHIFNQIYTELFIMYLILQSINIEKVKGIYEPISNTNLKRTEFKILLDTYVLNIEVKVLNFEESFDQVLKQTFNNNTFIFKEFIPLSEEYRKQLQYKILIEKRLNIQNMVYYRSEYRKINKRIKDANGKFNQNEKYNILFINYNEGIDSKEVIKCIMDDKEGIMYKNNNMNNIDAVVVLSLSQKCYTLQEIQHAKSNCLIVLNHMRGNMEVQDILLSLGFENIVDLDSSILDYEIYMIVMFDEIKQYVVVPYNTDPTELYKDVLRFIIAQDNLDKELDQFIENIKVNSYLKGHKQETI